MPGLFRLVWRPGAAPFTRSRARPEHAANAVPRRARACPRPSRRPHPSRARCPHRARACGSTSRRPHPSRARCLARREHPGACRERDASPVANTPERTASAMPRLSRATRSTSPQRARARPEHAANAVPHRARAAGAGPPHRARAHRLARRDTPGYAASTPGARRERGGHAERERALARHDTPEHPASAMPHRARARPRPSRRLTRREHARSTLRTRSDRAASAMPSPGASVPEHPGAGRLTERERVASTFRREHPGAHRKRDASRIAGTPIEDSRGEAPDHGGCRLSSF